MTYINDIDVRLLDPSQDRNHDHWNSQDAAWMGDTMANPLPWTICRGQWYVWDTVFIHTVYHIQPYYPALSIKYKG